MPARQADPIVRPTLVATPTPQRAIPRAARSSVVGVAVTALLALHWLLGTSALRHKCTTVDEIIHLAAGCSYWLQNDYRLQPENGNLPQRWHALPIVLTGRGRLPGPEHPAWKRSDVWEIGWSMFYEVGNDPDLLLARGRALAALVGVGVCLTVFLWSRRLFGLWGAFVSLVLAVFCPALLAHGPLMTSDACLTLFLLLSVWAIWELLHEITPLRLAGGMLAIAGLFLSKMSAPLILPMAGLMVLVRLFAQQPLVVRWGCHERVLPLRRQQLAAAFAVMLACGMFTYAAVWAAYGFRYSAFAGGPLTDAQFYKLRDIPTACDVIPGRSGKVIAWMADKRILPEAYLYGTAFVVAHLRRVAFLNGQYSMDGWWYYFPYCFAVKTPLALGGILALATTGLWRVPKPSGDRAPPAAAIADRSWYALTPLVILLVVFWASAVRSTFNIGYRHILPVYPALYILAGGAGRWLDADKRVMRVAVIGMVGLFAIDSLAAYPHYLAYFNQLLPREEAYQHLVDSNLDWGQDLQGLKCWLDAHNSGPNQQQVYLAYWGKGNPAHEGIDAMALTNGNRFHSGQQLGAGLYCISASGLQAVFEDAPGHWNKMYEEHYQARRRLIQRLNDGERVVNDGGMSLTAADIDAARRAYEYGQYLRLLAFLRQRRPDAMVGYSILIFDLTAVELEQALTGPPPELDEQPWLPKRVNFL